MTDTAASLELGVIGNCSFAALVDRQAKIVWCCIPRFDGAAEYLQEALIVNPYDADDVAQAMQRAIEMPRGERVERHAALLKRVREQDACHWMRNFLRVLEASPLPLAA